MKCESLGQPVHAQADQGLHILHIIVQYPMRLKLGYLYWQGCLKAQSDPMSMITSFYNDVN